jgi:ubiquinone/menaquinone biosynthesis C-methylase UbiE
MKIDIGGGKNPKHGFKVVDIIPEADFCINLETESLPFEKESITEIYSNHTFEHIQNVIHLMNECWRVLEWEGKLEVIVPHKDCTLAWQDPTHVRFWTEENMKYFCGEYLKKHKLNYGIRCCFKMLKNEITAPDGRPEYFKQIHFVMIKDKNYAQEISYPECMEKN